MKWIECQGCWAEYKVISDTDEPVSYCPYCGGTVEVESEDEEEEE